MYQNFWDTFKAVITGKFRSLNTIINKNTSKKKLKELKASVQKFRKRATK